MLERAREASKFVTLKCYDLFVCVVLMVHLTFYFFCCCRGKPVLLPNILHLLREELGVDAKVDDNNVGRVRVSGASIDQFIESKRWKE